MLSCCLILFAAPSLAAPVVLPLARSAGIGEDSLQGVEITGRVFFGDKASFDPDAGGRVGTLRAKDVYLKIPAYRRILDEDIDKDSALGKKLIKEATTSFRKGVRAASRHGNLVLVVEEGGIQGYPTSDITARVIESL